MPTFSKLLDWTRAQHLSWTNFCCELHTYISTNYIHNTMHATLIHSSLVNTCIRTHHPHLYLLFCFASHSHIVTLVGTDKRTDCLDQVGSQLFDNTVQMVPTRRSFSSPAPLAAVPVPPGAMKLSSSGSSSENLLPPVTVLDASSLSSGRRSSTPSGSVTVNSWLVNLLYSARSPRGSSARISLRGVASLKKTKLTSEESPDGEDAEDNMEDVKDYLL